MRSGEMLLLLLPLAAADAVASELPMTSAVPASRCCCCLLSSACCSRLPACKDAALMLPLSRPPELKLLLCLYDPAAAADKLPAGARFALVGLVLQAAALLNSVLLALLLMAPGAVVLGAAAGGVQLYGLLLLLLVALAAAAAMVAASGDFGEPVLLRGLQKQRHMQAG
jgi:hypothetical protein